MQEDKLWHFLASMALVLVFYACQACCCCKNMICGLISASIMAFIVGVAKEVTDAVSDEWPWCNPTCQFDIKDLLANAAGIAAGCISVLLFRCCWVGSSSGTSNSESRPVPPAEDSQV
jgi:xanthine/uracil/vitamin C permease (AzgA family)